MGLLTAGVSLLSLALLFQEPAPTPAPSTGTATEQRLAQADQLLRNAKQVALFGTVGEVAARGIALNPSADKAQ